MYAPADRERIRADLLDAARSDARITGGAITGSASQGREDALSDIDLAFGVRDASDMNATMRDFTTRMYERHDAVHHFDMSVGAWIYRVFLLRSTMQVDLAFVPAAQFGARAPTFRLVFGEAREVPQIAPPVAEELIGLAWLYALHVRSSLGRNHWWQAEYMISAMRDYILALACVRRGLPAVHGRGMDRLPRDVTTPLAGALVRSLEPGELKRAFGVAMECLVREAREVDPDLAERLEPTLLELSALD